jgi:hypothetical protein
VDLGKTGCWGTDEEQLLLPVRTVWLDNSNDAVLTTELARRTVRFALDAGVERPWLRVRDGGVIFTHPDVNALDRLKAGRSDLRVPNADHRMVRCGPADRNPRRSACTRRWPPRSLHR